MQRMYVIKGRKMMLGLIKKEQKWEIALQTTLGFKLLWSCYGFFKTRTTEAFFHQNPKLLGLGRQFRQINSGSFWVFSVDLSGPILVQWIPCPCFPLINHYFYKNLSLYTQIVCRSPRFNNLKVFKQFSHLNIWSREQVDCFLSVL